MVSQEDKSKQPETPHVCQTCKFHQVPSLSLPAANGQRLVISMPCGACTNEQDELAPHGVMMAPFASCEFWQEKPQQNVIKVPMGSKLAKRFGGG